MDANRVSIRSIRFLRGPNVYAHKPAMHVVLDIGPYEELPSSSFPGFTERITAWLPTLHQHECSVGRPGGFVERLRGGTYLGHIVEHVTLELQNLVGFDVGFGRARGTGEPGVYNVLIAYEEEEVVRAAFDIALRMVLAAMHDEPFDAEAEIESLRRVTDEYRLGPSTGAIVDAARARKIPVTRITPTGSLVQLGYGVRQKRIWAAQTSSTSALALEVCQDKTLTNQILGSIGVPVPRGSIVTSADEAWRLAQEIGLPVVVKPAEGNQGKGVSVRLSTEEMVRSAHALASEHGPDVLVERYVEGNDYRLLVVGGKLVAAARRDPALVVGDGESTVEELIELANRDPRRREGHSSALTRITVDDSVHMVLSQQQLSLDSVPEMGRMVRLRRNANLSTGGTAADITDEVHPRNVRVAELAAQAVGLDIAGVDVVCRDIRRPLDEQGGAIVEVNAAPGLRMHLRPSEGQPRDVGAAVVEMLYPDGHESRVPIISVTGTNGKTTVVGLLAHMYATARKVVGMTTTEGIYVGGERIIKGDCAGPQSARTVLLHPQVEVAVLETARGGILREGLAFDRCKVGVVTNISADHLGLRGVHTLEDLARVKQVVVEAVEEGGAAVLNAEDRLVAEMAAACRGEVVYFSTAENHPVVVAHLAASGRCVLVEDGRVVLAANGDRMELLELERLTFTGAGRIRFQLENALAATAAAWAEGLNPALIARALSTFRTDSAFVPGRFNVMSLAGREVIVDYGHNAAALAALGQAVESLDKRQTVMLLSLPGDRRDEDLVATFQATLPYVDEHIIYDLADMRGREAGEVFRLLRDHIPPGQPVGYAAAEREGLERLWQRAQPGDRAIFIVDDVDAGLEAVRRLAGAGSEEEHEEPDRLEAA
jgi:cyanophycin synthetase